MKKLLSVFFGLVILAACEDAPEQGSSPAFGGDFRKPVVNDSRYSSSDFNAIGSSNFDSGQQEKLVQEAGDRVYFATDSSVLNSEAQAVLRAQAEWLKSYTDLNVLIEGHCDERGTREYNLALGERRANSVKKYLTKLGVSKRRISTVSYGKERPAVVGSGAETWAQNRRSVTVVTN